MKAILCVDDEKSILSGLQQQIERAFKDQYLLEFAQSGNEALEVMADYQAAGIEVMLVITDQMMPGMTGNELVSTIYQLYPAVHCIILSGYTEHEVKNHFSCPNLLAFFHKPWEQEELITGIRSITDLS
jgi:YesN/AraC family two-component response regulator